MVSYILDEDIKQCISDNNIMWHTFADSNVLITGAGGLIGSAIARVLCAANKERGLNIAMFGCGRDLSKGEAVSRECGLTFVQGDIRNPELFMNPVLPSAVDYIFHCASVTKSADMAAKPVDVITTAVDGTRNILQLAKQRYCKSFVYLSSMEVYGVSELAEVSEKDLGYIDLYNPRSCYPESKRLCESLCAAYYTQYNLPVKIARLAQTFGAGTPKDDTRVFAQFARSAMAGEDIILHTDGKSRGNYCYTADTVRGLLTLLFRGKDGEAYNTANPAASATIREMAEIVANDLYGGEISVVTKIPEENQGYAPHTGYVLNTDKLNALGFVPQYKLPDMYKRMIADWKGQL